MPTGQSVKEFSFISYFLFSHSSCDQFASTPLATERSDSPDCSPSTNVRSFRDADQGVQGSGERERTEAGDKVKREKRQAAADKAKKSEMEMIRETVG